MGFLANAAGVGGGLGRQHLDVADASVSISSANGSLVLTRTVYGSTTWTSVTGLSRVE